VSATDRNHLLDGVLRQFASDESVIYCDSTVVNKNSAHDMLVEITQNFAAQIHLKAEIERRINSFPSSLLDGLSDFPDPILSELFRICSKQNSKTVVAPTVMMIVLRHMERIDSTVFGDLLERLHLIPGIRFLVIGAHSAYQELPLFLSPFPQTILRASVIETASAWELYDTYMGKLFTTEELLVVLHPRLIGHVNATFIRAHKCLFSSVSFILHCYQKHFAGNVSVLSTYRDKDLLVKVCIIACIYSIANESCRDTILKHTVVSNHRDWTKRRNHD
jgi:hypothetical protein